MSTVNSSRACLRGTRNFPKKIDIALVSGTYLGINRLSKLLRAVLKPEIITDDRLGAEVRTQGSANGRLVILFAPLIDLTSFDFQRRLLVY